MTPAEVAHARLAPVVSDHDDPRLRAELVLRLQQMLIPPGSMAPPRWLTAAIRDDAGGLLGGVIGLTTGLWLSVELLWVHQELRRQGLGRVLVRSVEMKATARGCLGAYVETSSKAARRFYEHADYRIRLIREEAEPGLVRYTLQKRFQRLALTKRGGAQRSSPH